MKNQPYRCQFNPRRVHPIMFMFVMSGRSKVEGARVVGIIPLVMMQREVVT